MEEYSYSAVESTMLSFLELNTPSFRIKHILTGIHYPTFHWKTLNLNNFELLIYLSLLKDALARYRMPFPSYLFQFMS